MQNLITQKWDMHFLYMRSSAQYKSAVHVIWNMISLQAAVHVKSYNITGNW
jgi:hypothetical protein